MANYDDNYENNEPQENTRSERNGFYGALETAMKRPERKLFATMDDFIEGDKQYE